MPRRRTEHSPKDKMTGLDDLETRIQQEVEEFLRDLTLEFPFPEIFEILKRHEFKGRYGSNVTPIPQRKFSPEVMKEIHQRIDAFFGDLKKNFGSRHEPFIQQCFAYYTETTLE